MNGSGYAFVPTAPGEIGERITGGERRGLGKAGREGVEGGGRRRWRVGDGEGHGEAGREEEKEGGRE